MSPRYVLFTVCSRSKPWSAAHVPFLCLLLTEQLRPGHILATVEPGKLILSCLSRVNLHQLDLGALKEHGKGEERTRWGVLGNSSKEEYKQERPAVFSSDTTQAECSPLNGLHSAVQQNQYYTVKQVIFTAQSVLQLLL